MALTGSKRDWLSAYPGTIEFEGFWGAIEGLLEGDIYGTGPIPMPRPARAPVPDAISEVAETWEELEALEPELFEPILETRPGRVADSYPQDVAETVEPEDDVAETWGDWFFETATGVIGDYINPPAAGMAQPAAMFPSTPANQAATAAALGGNGVQDCDGMTWAGGAPPKGYKVVRDSCGNGVLRKVRRRRRRRMLTAGDKADIAAIISMAGKGQLATSLINRSTN